MVQLKVPSRSSPDENNFSKKEKFEVKCQIKKENQLTLSQEDFDFENDSSQLPC
jgi:hypothetical protein